MRLRLLRHVDANSDYCTHSPQCHALWASIKNAAPTKNIPPMFLNNDERAWVKLKLGEIIDSYVYPSCCKKDTQEYITRGID